MPTAAVVGCGDVSIVHFGAIERLAGVELVGVCDVDPAAAAHAHERWGVAAFRDHQALLAALRPDVVHVCTPHDQHAPVVIDCLESGIAVIVEKPLAATMSEAEKIITAAAEQPQIKIGVCLQNRYNATIQAIRAQLDTGQLGKVLGGHGTVMWHRTATYYTSRPWRGRIANSGGGVLINQAIHTLDLLQWLLGDVSAVDGHASRSRTAPGVDVEDTATLMLDHTSGAHSMLVATTANVVDSPVTLEIDTEHATFFVRGDLTVRHADGRVEVVRERSALSEGRGYWGVSHQLLIEDFYDRLKDPQPFWLSPLEAAKSQRIIEQVYTGSYAG
jgi:UDP-N-acetyl-2-amino-2-deoxyglucuronate dehydrogenase